MANFAGEPLGAEYISFKAIPQPKNSPDGTLWFDSANQDLEIQVAGVIYHIPLAKDVKLFTVRTTLTKSQIMHLGATPIVLAAAPGAGFYLCPQTVEIQYDYVGDHYIENGGNFVVGWGSPVGSGVFADFEENGFIDQASSQMWVQAIIMTGPLNVSDIANKGIYISSNPTSPEITANSSATNGTLHVTLTFTLESIA